jgi:hypothetical protein
MMSAEHRVFLKWGIIGVLVAAFLLLTQSMAVGGFTGLLDVGELSALRPLIERELGELSLAPGYGHDGQIYYAIALDLRGEFVPDLLDHAGFRYRRILMPLLASGFGLLGGWPLLYGMILVTVLSTGLATGAAALIAHRGRLTQLAALAVLLNPGVWLSIRLLTADILALGLMLGALAMLTSRRRLSAATFALATLAKDTFLMTPAGLAVTRDRRKWLPLILSVVALVAVMAWTTVTVGDGFAARGNLTWPLVGIAQASSNWSNLGVGDIIFLIFALVSVFAGLIIGVRHRTWLRWPILTWSVLGLISSSWVWDFGNNAARAFAPIAVLVALSLAGPSTAEDVA